MNLWTTIKGLLVKDETDKTKEISLEIDPGATTGTRTTLKSAQTASRTVVLPDSSDTLVGKATTDTLTNKSIDADTNTITNIENENIKVGAAIDAAKLADGTVSNTEYQYINSVTSNVQTQLDAGVAALSAHISDAVDAHDGSAISNIPAGTITSTDVQGAINEQDTHLTNHLSDATDAHDGSAISNIPSGNLAATDVQGALNELQTDIDTRATSAALTAHISDSTDAHTASAITNIPSGNLTAIEVQSALNELQTDIDGIASGTSTASNVGTGVGEVFKQKVLNDLQFRTIKAGTNILVTNNTDDVTVTLSVGVNQIVNAQLAEMPAHTIKGNNTAITADAADLTATEVTAELNSFVGDSGSGGTKGLVPAPAIGDSTKFLKGDGTWSTTGYSYVSQSSTLNPAVLGTFYLLSGASFNSTLPTAVGKLGQTVTFRHGGTFGQVYTFLTTSGQTIGGIASGLYAFYTPGEEFTLISDDSVWQIENRITSSDEVDAGPLFISSTAAYTFTITSATVVAGDVYSNNGQSFVVTSSGTVTSMPTSGTGAPAASGTLTLTFGTGDPSLTFSSVSSSIPVKGTTTHEKFIWWREGSFVNYRYDANWAATGGSGGLGEYRLFYAANLLPDTTNLQVNPGTGIPTRKSMVGQGVWSNVNNSTVQVGYLFNANTIAMSLLIQSTGVWSAGIGALGNQTDFSIQGRYKVLGWQP